MKIIALFLFLACSLSFYSSFAQTNTNYTISEKKSKFGYLKPNSKKWAIKPQFDGALAFGERLDSNFAFAKKDTLWGVIDKTGKWVVMPTYEAIFEYEGYSKNYKKDNQFAKSLLGKRRNKNVFLNKKGDTLTPAFSYISKFRDTEFGYTYEYGNSTLVSDKSSFNIYSNFFTIYDSNKKVIGFYEYLGDGLVRKIYGECEQIKLAREDVIVISKLVNGKIKKGLYNISSKKSTPIENDDIYILPYNLAYYILTNNSLKGVIDRNFSVVLPTEYDNIYNYNYDSLVVVAKKDKRGLLDKNFVKIFETEYTIHDIGVGYYKNKNVCYYALKKNGFWGIYNTSGKQTISHILQEAYPIISYNDRDGFIIFKENNKCGIMNAITGEILVKPIYDELQFYNYESWYLVSSLSKKFGRISIKDNKITQIIPIYDKMIQNSIYNEYGNTIDLNFTWYLNGEKFKWDNKDQKFISYDKIDKPQGYTNNIYDIIDNSDKIKEIYILQKK